MEITRHFTATTFIVCADKVLLHMHRRQHKWLPVGGHIDRDELPHEAALREVREESGCEVELYVPQKLMEFQDVKELPPPVHLLLEDINPYHQHIDFIYYARSRSLEIDSTAEEADSLRWFTLSEIEATVDMPADVLALAREALELLGD